ncbi:hypothetical protein HZB08_00245 [Candidatus Saganbacteria bacterium]|uniref:Fibronectin type-III domain-containing protein n=1 Tax=Candidatus Saganbacteria bacterium TaxID=2575572 RepID=A0A9D6YUW6_UNCSA|nr:hypothetical protein [Candidatus Saganbacteria bacterium]
MIKKIILMGGLLFLLFDFARADVLISTYKVDGFDSNNLEVGATFKVTVRYQNTTGSSQTIVGAKFYLDYDNTYVDNISESAITDNLAGSLTSKTNPNFTPVNGQVRYQRDAGAGNGLTVANNDTIDCFTLTFHLKQDDNNAGSRAILNWLAPTADNVKLVIAGGGNVSGTVNPFQNATLKTAAAPTFSGLNTVSDPQSGNTLNLDWTTYGNAANDLTDGAATYYSGHDGQHNGQGLRYNIYRGTISPPASKVVSERNSFTYTNTGLDDTVTYYFTVRAQDDCTPSHNEEQNSNILSATPHDYTPPGAPTSFNAAAGDSSIALSWSNPGASDFAGVIIVRKPDGSTPSPSLVSASGNNDGAVYNAGEVLSDGSVVKYKGTGTAFTDTALTNGVNYLYKIYAFDLATNGPPKQQGNNYSSAVSTSGTPGVAPDNVANLRALAGTNSGDITLKWTNPIIDGQGSIVPAKAAGYGGSRIVWTTDYGKWNNITVNSADTDPANYSKAEKLIPNQGDPNQTPSEESAAISSLSTLEVYYFRVFPFNITADIATRAYTSGIQVAAVPMRGTMGTTERLVTVEVEKIDKNVQKTQALGGPLTGEVTLKWVNPLQNFPEYRGAKITYTTNENNWDSLTTAEANVRTVLSTDNPNDSVVFSNLSTAEVYYFKIFAFGGSDPNVVYQSGAGVVGKPSLGWGVIERSVTEEVQMDVTREVSVSIRKKSGGFGVNSIGLPFEPPFMINGRQIETFQQLIDAINSVAGGKVISAVGYWDEENQRLVGATFDGSGNVTYSASGFDANARLKEGKGYYFSVAQDISGLKLTKPGKGRIN